MELFQIGDLLRKVLERFIEIGTGVRVVVCIGGVRLAGRGRGSGEKDSGERGGLADGTPVTFDGEFFSFQDALIAPAPSPRVPLIVGGRSEAAVSRAARLGDGWLGIWISPRRFATDLIAPRSTSREGQPIAQNDNSERAISKHPPTEPRFYSISGTMRKLRVFPDR